MYNKKVLSEATKNLDRTVAPAKKKDIIKDPMGQWKYPGENTRIQGNDITMQGVPYPVWAQPNVGPGMMMQPDSNYQFPNADYVDEFPMAAYGGDISIPDLSQYEDGGEYDLTDDEIEQLKKGGYVVEHLPSLPKKKGSKGYSKSLMATNRLFAQNPLLKKPKSKKNKIFDPNAKQFKKGGFQDDLGKHRQLLRDWTYGQSIGMLQEAQTGEEIKNLPEITVTPGGYKGPTNLNPVNNVLFNTPQIQQNIALSKGKGPTAQGAKAIKSSKAAQDRAKFNEYANNQMQAKADWEKRSSGAAQPVDEFWTLPLAATRAPYMAGEALSGLMATELPGLAGTTVGQGLNAGFITKGILDAPSTVRAWQDVAAGKKDWKDAAEKTAWNLLDFTGAGETKEGLKLLGEDARAASNYLTTQTPLRNAYKINPLANRLGEYNRVVGHDAVDDIVESGLVRVNENAGVAQDLGPFGTVYRTTPYPSFGKAKPQQTYADQVISEGKTPYIISTDRPMKASTLGRHGRGTTQFPVDEAGKYMKGFPASEAKVYEFGEPHWLKGYKDVSIPPQEMIDLWRIQEKGARPMAELAAEGKLGPMFQNEKAIQHFKDREKYFGQWFTKNKNDFDFYKTDREFIDPEIIQLKVPKNKLQEFQNYDKSLSRASDREFVIPSEQQELYRASNTPVRSGIGGMNMSRYEIKNPDYFKQLLDTYDSKALSPTNKKFYKDLIESVKKQEGLVTERQYNELQRLKSGNFNFGKKAYDEGGYIEVELTPQQIKEYRDGGYIVDELD